MAVNNIAMDGIQTLIFDTPRARYRIMPIDPCLHLEVEHEI